MIDLARSRRPSPLLHTVAFDPGLHWAKAAVVAIDAAPDDDTAPRPEATWPREARRSGVCGAVSPRVVALADGGYRLYYSQILPRPGFPAGANDYDNASTRILSAFSADGVTWTPEPGVRLSPRDAGAGEFRVVSSEVVPVGDGSKLRMYYECCAGPQSVANAIASALSVDGGWTWTPDPGVRLAAPGRNFSAPRIVFRPDGGCRLYCYERGTGIVSAVSDDGLAFRREAGVRLAEDSDFDRTAAFAPEIVLLPEGRHVMYYAGYGQPNRAYILRAESDDGLTWRKHSVPVIAPGPGGWDAAKCSEMCLVRLPAGSASPFALLYEACDGTAAGERGVWRIALATAITSPG